MSLILEKLCKRLLREHFGSIVEEVATVLFKHGSRTFHQIKINVKIPLSKLKEALCILIKFGYVMYEQDEKEKGPIIYTLAVDKIITILRYPRYMYQVKQIMGDEAERVLEEVLKSGFETASQIIVRTYKKLQELPPERQATVPVLKEKFELLVQHQYLVRSLCTDIISDLPTDKPDYSMPTLNVRALIRLTQGYEADAGDNKIYWRVNFDKFHEDLRDQILISAIARRIDDNAGELMRQLLYSMSERTASWSDTSIPVPLNEIRERVRKNAPHLIPYLEQYVSILVDDSSNFIQKVGDSGGGQYSINMKEAFHQLAWATIENVVTERFGSKAARIFRLIRSHRYIDQEKIQQLAMMGSKEAKHLTFKLMEDNYLQIQELKKLGITTGPAKVYFLFHIDIDQVVRMTIEHCYHSLYNIIQRRVHEVSSNKRMIDKQLRIKVITENLKKQGAKEEQLAEVEEMMSPAEKLQLEQVHERIRKLGSNEFCIDDTLFLLEMYIRYHK